MPISGHDDELHFLNDVANDADKWNTRLASFDIKLARLGFENTLNRSASLAMSTSILEALPGKLDIKRHTPSILYDFNENNISQEHFFKYIV